MTHAKPWKKALPILLAAALLTGVTFLPLDPMAVKADIVTEMLNDGTYDGYIHAPFTVNVPDVSPDGAACSIEVAVNGDNWYYLTPETPTTVGVKSLAFWVNAPECDIGYNLTSHISDFTADSPYYLINGATGAFETLNVAANGYTTISAGFAGYIVYDLSDKDVSQSKLSFKIYGYAANMNKVFYFDNVFVSSNTAAEVAEHLSDISTPNELVVNDGSGTGSNSFGYITTNKFTPSVVSGLSPDGDALQLSPIAGSSDGALVTVNMVKQSDDILRKQKALAFRVHMPAGASTTIGFQFYYEGVRFIGNVTTVNGKTGVAEESTASGAVALSDGFEGVVILSLEGDNIIHPSWGTPYSWEDFLVEFPSATWATTLLLSVDVGLLNEKPLTLDSFTYVRDAAKYKESLKPQYTVTLPAGVSIVGGNTKFYEGDKVTLQTSGAFKGGMLFGTTGGDNEFPIYKRVGSIIYETTTIFDDTITNQFVFKMPAANVTVMDTAQDAAITDANAGENSLVVFGASYRDTAPVGLQFGSRALRNITVGTADPISYSLNTCGTIIIKQSFLDDKLVTDTTSVPGDYSSWREWLEAVDAGQTGWRFKDSTSLLDRVEPHVDFALRLHGDTSAFKDTEYVAVAYGSYVPVGGGTALELESLPSAPRTYKEVYNAANPNNPLQ